MRSAGLQLMIGLCRLALGAALMLAVLVPVSHAQGIVAFRIDAGRPHDDRIETRFARCIADAFPPPGAFSRDSPAAALRDAMFPWLDPEVVPITEEDFARLLETALVRERLENMGIRYLVVLTAMSTGRQSKDAMAMIPYGGFWGMLEERQGYAVRASVWDVSTRTVAGSGFVSWSVKVGAAGIFLPVPFYSSGEATACDEIVTVVRGAIEGRK